MAQTRLTEAESSSPGQPQGVADGAGGEEGVPHPPAEYLGQAIDTIRQVMLTYLPLQPGLPGLPAGYGCLPGQQAA